MRATEAQTLGETNSGVVNAQARLASAKAVLAQAKADLVRIQSDSQRMIELAKAGVESDQDRVRAEAQLDAQQAVVHSAQKNVDAAQGRPEHRHCEAPSAARGSQQRRHERGAGGQRARAMGRSRHPAGLHENLRAGERHGFRARHAPGRSGESGEPIVTIIDFNDTWVRAEAPETEARFVADGDKLKVRLPAGKPIEGTVIFKAVESDYATQRDVSRRKRDIKTIGLKLKVDNPDGALVPGMTAEVLLPKDLSTRMWRRVRDEAEGRAGL